MIRAGTRNRVRLAVSAKVAAQSRASLPLQPLLKPLLPAVKLRPNSTTTSSSSSSPSSFAKSDNLPSRHHASFFISNVFPIPLGNWDIRPSLAIFLEEPLLEKLNAIASQVEAHDFRVESWEIARKDGGVLCHFSYIPPLNEDSLVPSSRPDGIASVLSLPEAIKGKANSPAYLFLPLLVESARKHGGWPSWLGKTWANWIERAGEIGNQGGEPGHRLYNRASLLDRVGEEGEEVAVKGSGTGLSGSQAVIGGGRIWFVKGRQWTEDMNRFPSTRLRVEFEGPDVSQEMLYILFRPYGRLRDIIPPSPVPSGSLRYAIISYTRVSPATAAINCLHGFSTPTNTGDFTLRASGTEQSFPLSRLRLFYERPLKAHFIRDWISSHPRIALPVLAFLIGTLSYTFFDPIRAFFVRSKLEGVWDLDNYSLIKQIRSKLSLPSSLNLFGSSSSTSGKGDDAIGQNAWRDREEAEKSVERWLSEYPSTFITITGPPGSGKVSLVNRVIKKQGKPALIIDCAEIGKSKNDNALVSSLAEQTGYYPVFSFLSSLNGLIDLAAVGLIGQKTGFSTPVDQQLRGILEVVGGALKDVSAHSQDQRARAAKRAKDQIELAREKKLRREMIIRGGWHDGRLDCVAGNGVMSELGLGEEPTYDIDLECASSASSSPSAKTLAQGGDVEKQDATAISTSNELDAEAEQIQTMPIVVLKNYAQKAAKGDLWNVLAEWGASLVENHVAHVIVVAEGATATKALTKALPSKPLNSIGLSDADQANSLAYVVEKLGLNGGNNIININGNSSSSSSSTSIKTNPASLSPEEKAQIAKLGGRMVDLETLVYKVRTGSTIRDAVDDIVSRTVIELRKLAFGDDSEDAKNLPWSRAQAWKVVSELAKNGEASYAQLLQDFPFKGAESSLKALEEHELISVTSVEGRASKIRPGKPVYRYAFGELVNDAVFKASSQIEYNSAIIAKAEADIRTIENELTTLKDITSGGGDQSLGVSKGSSTWLVGLGLGKSSAIQMRAQYLLDKLGKSVDKLAKLEAENVEQLKVLASGRP